MPGLRDNRHTEQPTTKVSRDNGDSSLFSSGVPAPKPILQPPGAALWRPVPDVFLQQSIKPAQKCPMDHENLTPRPRVIARRSCHRPHCTKGELECRHLMNKFKAKKEHPAKLDPFDLSFSSGVVNKSTKPKKNQRR